MYPATFYQPFLMEVNSRFVVNLPQDDDERHPSKIGDRSDTAVFNISNGYMRSDDRFMGRLVLEPKVFMPMQVVWMKDSQDGQQCQTSGAEEEPKLITNGFS
ncbi:hypothetical protein COCCADRAFT_76531, partial [Bipolaris zeicola 26-R-13]